MRVRPIGGWSVGLVVIGSVSVVLSGCGKKAAPVPVANKPAGRLVPAVVASFEQGAGGWKALGTAGFEASPTVQDGEAARGDRWLAIKASLPQGEESGADLYGEVPSRDWTRFGDTIRADVKAVPATDGAYAQLFIVTPDGKKTAGPEEKVSGAWKTLVWKAGPSLTNVGRIGVHWRIAGPWTGQVGIDNVRVGAADALSTAYSVATGPFPSRDAASQSMRTLAAANVQSFPVYEQGWYLNLGTFSTRAAASKEAQRLQSQGIPAQVLVR